MPVSLRLALMAVWVVLGVLNGRANAGDGEELAPPFAVTVNSVPIDLGKPDRIYEVFPWIGDFDGDGKADLLLGQDERGESRRGYLRIYRNLGVEGIPWFAKPTWFDDRVPTRCIPPG